MARKGRPAPIKALSLAAQHERLFPRGALAQEREVIAIEALVRAGRGGEARARAARFRRSFAESAHTRRVGVLLKEIPGQD